MYRKVFDRYLKLFLFIAAVTFVFDLILIGKLSLFQSEVTFQVYNKYYVWHGYKWFFGLFSVLGILIIGLMGIIKGFNRRPDLIFLTICLIGAFFFFLAFHLQVNINDWVIYPPKSELQGDIPDYYEGQNTRAFSSFYFLEALTLIGTFLSGYRLAVLNFRSRLSG